MAESNTTLRFKVAPTWKGEYILGNEYQQSDEVSFTHDNGSLAQLEDVLFGHYRSLKPNNINPLPKGSELIEDEYGRHGNDWLLILDLSDVEEATVKSMADNATFNNNESVRITHENARISNENSRISNENIRKSNETARESNEARRVNNETTRNTSENTRKQNEDIRKANENSRKGAETTRQNNEDFRIGNESTRISNEEQRVNAEGSVQSQTGRAYAESLRVTAEQNRVNAENQRQIAEGTPDDTPSIDGSRWARYKQAEIGRTTSFNESQTNRTNQYNQAEGTPEDAASATGSRWARFNYNEEQRDTKVDEKVEDITNLQEKVTTLETEKANKNGYYSELTAGAAESLVGQTTDSDAYLIRPTATSDEATNEVANGNAEVVGLEGQSCVWNQTFPFAGTITVSGVTFKQNSNGSYTVTGTNTSSSSAFNVQSTNYTVISGHKYYYRIIGNSKVGYDAYSSSLYLSTGGIKYKSAIYTATGSGRVILRLGVAGNVTDINETVNVVFIDLTLLGIDNLTTVKNVEEWLAQHVGTKPYYAYNSGTILSAQTLGFKTYGQNLLNPTTKQAKLIPYTWGENSNVYTIKNVPSANDLQITYTPDATGEAVTIDTTESIPDSINISDYGGSGMLYISSATADTYVCMKWDGKKDNDVVPYKEHSYDFDVRKVYGKVSGAGEYVQCYPNGMKSAGSIHDTLTASKAVSKIGSVDLGSLTWYMEGVRFYSLSLDGLATSSDSICQKYVKASASNVYSGIDKVMYTGKSGYFSTNTYGIYINDSSYNTTDSFKTAMSGVILNYYLASPITYTDLVYRDNGVDTPFGEVLLQMQVNNWSIEEQLIAPYTNVNPTSIPATVNTIYSIDAVEALDTLNKNCYFADDVKTNLQALLTCINTNCSETLGGTFSISETATNKVFAFSFTPNTEPDVEPTNEGE